MSESLRVAVFASQFLPHRGGVEEVVRQLNRHLPSHGIQPTVLVNRWPRDLPACEDVEGTRVHRLAFRMPSDQLKSKVTYALTHRAITREAVRVVRGMRAELLHVHCMSSNAEYALRIRQATGLPLVVTTHGEVTNDAGQLFRSRSGWPMRVLRECVQTSDALTAPTQSCLDDAIAWSGVETHATTVIGNGVSALDFRAGEDESRRFQPGENGAYLCAVGRLVPQKGFDVLLEAVAALRRDGQLAQYAHPITVKIIGEGPERTRLEVLIAQHGLHGSVELLGQQGHSEVSALLRGACLAVLPSRAEAFGIVNLEAMAAGCPVVTTNLPGIREFVTDNVDALLVPPDDVTALANAIARLLAEQSTRSRLAAAGWKTAARNDWSAIAALYAGVYRSVIAKRLACAKHGDRGSMTTSPQAVSA